MQKRYGWKFGLPTTILAASVGISRITSQRHTTLQVLAGALLGYGVSYLCAKRLKYIALDIDIGTAAIPAPQGIAQGAMYENVYKANVSYRF